MRFYERKGLLEEPPRNDSGYRQYPPEAIIKLCFIKRAKTLGFSLQEIRELFTLRHKQDTTCGDVRIQAEDKIQNIEEKIRDLTRMKGALVELTCQCSGQRPVSECPILTALEPPYNSSTGMVTYRSKMTHGKNKKNFSISRAEEFIAATAQHIPDKSFQLVRYHGWYSNRMRGERRKLEEEVAVIKDEKKGKDISELTMIDVAAYKPLRIPPPLWQDCTPRVFASRHIKKIWEVGSLNMPALPG